MTWRVIILGAGISGLAAANYLRKWRPEWDVKVIEQSEHAGGWIRSEFQDGILCELGPRSCRLGNTGLETLQLCRDLGLEEEILYASSKAKRRFLLNQGKVDPMPRSLLGFFTGRLTRRLPMTLLRECFLAPAVTSDETIYDFGMRRFGPYITETFLDPMVKGIYAGDMRQLSMRSCFPKLFEWERKQGSVVLGAVQGGRSRHKPSDNVTKMALTAGLFSFKGGLQTLPDALQEKLGNNVLFNRSASGLAFTGDEVRVHLSNGATMTGDFLISALPSQSLADLIAPLDSRITAILRGIPSCSIAVVNLAFKGDVAPLDGFGYLIPEKEREDVLGVVFDSSVFPKQGEKTDTTRLSVMIGGAHKPHLVESPDRDLEEIARNALREHLGIDREPDLVKVTRAREAIPQYLVGHESRICKLTALLERRFPRLLVCGNYLQGVAINDCIIRSKEVVNGLVEKASVEPLAACV